MSASDPILVPPELFALIRERPDLWPGWIEGGRVIESQPVPIAPRSLDEALRRRSVRG